MRTAFIETLYQLAERDERIWLLTGDLGYSVLERFASRFPDRYVNVGVAEQNMTGVAAGLALCGKIVFTYSIANFPTLRCLEQIRNDVCYHNANVKIAAVGGGYAYGVQGYTHHGVEDLAIMRALPNMTVIAPGDLVETRLATQAIVDWPGPCYLRLSKVRHPVVHQTEPQFQVGRAIVVRKGNDVTLISTGDMLWATVDAASLLKDCGVSTQVISMHTLHPLDIEAIHLAVSRTPRIVTIEEHSLVGGLGGAVTDLIMDQATNNNSCPFGALRVQKLGMGKSVMNTVGSRTHLLSVQGLTPTHIRDAVLRMIA